MVPTPDRPTIALLAPPAGGRTSGGHLVNAAWGHYLAGCGAGRLLPVAPPHLALVLAGLPAGTVAVLDSLYLTEAVPAALAAARQARPDLTVGYLLHYLPHGDPTLAPAARGGLRAVVAAHLELADFLIVTGTGIAAVLAREAADRAGDRAGSAPGGAVDPIREGEDFPGYPLRCPPIWSCPPPVICPAVTPQATAAAWAGAPHPRLLSVGTVAVAKGQGETLAVLADVPGPWSWRNHGDLGGEPGGGEYDVAPAYVAALAGRIAALGLDGRALLGASLPSAGLAALYAGADLLVSASRFESHGLAVAEAAARGLPCLAYAVGEHTAWVRDGVTGCLVAPSAPARWRAALRHLVMDPRALARFKAASARHRPHLPVRSEAESGAGFLRACRAAHAERQRDR